MCLFCSSWRLTSPESKLIMALSKGAPRMTNVKYYQGVGHVNRSQPEDLPCGPVPVETNLKLETDKTGIPKNSGQGAELVTDVLHTRVRSPCWSLSELQEWLEKVARVDLLEHDKKRDLWSLAIQELDLAKLPRTADPPIIICHNVLPKMRRLLWKTCCLASSTIHLLLDNWEFGCKSHLPTPTCRSGCM